MEINKEQKKSLQYSKNFNIVLEQQKNNSIKIFMIAFLLAKKLINPAFYSPHI